MHIHTEILSILIISVIPFAKILLKCLVITDETLIGLKSPGWLFFFGISVVYDSNNCSGILPINKNKLYKLTRVFNGIDLTKLANMPTGLYAEFFDGKFLVTSFGTIGLQICERS